VDEHERCKFLLFSSSEKWEVHGGVSSESLEEENKNDGTNKEMIHYKHGYNRVKTSVCKEITMTA
jgi:hypothetical protein